jgi:VanZ family protein
MRSILSRWLPVLIWATVIFFASANPDPYKPLSSRWIEPCFSAESNISSCAELLDRVLHISEYAILALLTARAMIWQKDVHFTSLVIVLGLTEFYALSDEFHQLFVPGRNFQLMDLALDLLGGMIGLIIYDRIRAKRRRI